MEYLRERLFGPNGARLDTFAEALTSLLAAPGRALLMIFSNPESDEMLISNVRDFALPLGIVCWLVALFVARVAWYATRRPEALARADRVTRYAVAMSRRIGHRVASQWRALAHEWTWPDVWGAAWRAEVVHLALYLGVPLLLESLRVLAFGLTLPFSVLGGYKGETFAGAVKHLKNPVCLVFASNCRSPSHNFRSATDSEKAQCSAGPCPPDTVWLVDPYWWVWKGAWAVIALAWIRRWRKRQPPAGALPPAA